MTERISISGYELVRELRRNGHVVYLARQASSGRLVQLNLADSVGEFGRKAANDLREQAETLRSLDHTNILRVVEIGEAEDHGFFTTLEHLGGGTLADRTSVGPLVPVAAVRVARALAHALSYAGERDVVAVDLRPSSIGFTDDGVPKLIDLCRAKDVRQRSARHGFYALTPSYAAPEEITDPQHIESWSSVAVYRVGAVLYQMLTGRPPFTGTPAETARQVLEGNPKPVRDWNPLVSSQIESLCMVCLAKSPHERYARESRLVEACDEWLWPRG